MAISSVHPEVATRRVLVAGVGYRNLRDLSVGPLAVERLGPSTDAVDIEDLSYGPVDVLFMLQGRQRYAAAIFVVGVHRGRQPGVVTRTSWRAPETTTEALQGRVAEALTGVISIDNLLEICAYFKALPPEVVLIEVEPAEDTWGEQLSAEGVSALASALALTRLEIARVLAS